MEHSTRLIQLGSHLFYNTHAHIFEHPIIRNHNITQLSQLALALDNDDDRLPVLYRFGDLDSPR